MTKAWTGEWPAVRCPVINNIVASFYGEIVAPNGDKLHYDWVVHEESSSQGAGGDKEYTPATFPELTTVNGEANCVFTTPETPGAYRLFVIVRDGKGGDATANIPFKVE